MIVHTTGEEAAGSHMWLRVEAEKGPSRLPEESTADKRVATRAQRPDKPTTSSRLNTRRNSLPSQLGAFITSHSPWPTISPPSSVPNRTRCAFFIISIHARDSLLTALSQVNCSFYYKIGACRHGDRCSRKHVKPSYSQTILLPNLYQNPAYDPKSKMNPQQLQNHFDAFYEDFWCEMCKYGEIEEVVVCDNNNDRE